MNKNDVLYANIKFLFQTCNFNEKRGIIFHIAVFFFIKYFYFILNVNI